MVVQLDIFLPPTTKTYFFYNFIFLYFEFEKRKIDIVQKLRDIIVNIKNTTRVNLSWNFKFKIKFKNL